MSKVTRKIKTKNDDETKDKGDENVIEKKQKGKKRNASSSPVKVRSIFGIKFKENEKS